LSEAAFVTSPLDGKVALVTGGSSGIGASTATRLASLGAVVVVLDRIIPPKEVGAASYRVLDLAATERIPSAVESIASQLGEAEILINCAGMIGRQGPSLFDVSQADFETVFKVNVLAPMLLVREFARRLVNKHRGGRIVNVTSSSAFRAHSPAIYSSSKAALGQFTRSAAAELGPHGINVNAVAPGLTDTALSRQTKDSSAMQAAAKSGDLANLLGRHSEPMDVAEVIVFLCLPESRQITGQTVHTSAGAVV
jgi:NAD(P)-dependent dehydrogenase (short-subunit alcohol dehydrogenase family)